MTLQERISVNSLSTCKSEKIFWFRHGLMLLWFTDLMNVIEEVKIHRPNVSTLLSSTFIRGDLNAATRGPFYMITK